KNQLWNILFVSNYNYNIGAQVHMTMTDMNSGQKVLTGTSGPITISKGAKQVKEADLEPVQYSYTGLNIALTGNAAGMLIAGKYMVCYTLIANDNKTELPVSEECVPVEIEPLAPPQLITPGDTSWVESNYPYFTWLPPSPVTMVPQLHYD